METGQNGIAAAEIMDGVLLISFDDGRYAIYSTELLLSVFSQAREIVPDKDDDLPL